MEHYHEKIKDEHKNIVEEEMSIQKMEEIENKLLNKLRNTKQIELSAYH
jgi:coproporphyrinogen III oxidase-like Fe-S oxidoreductase